MGRLFAFPTSTAPESRQAERTESNQRVDWLTLRSTAAKRQGADLEGLTVNWIAVCANHLLTDWLPLTRKSIPSDPGFVPEPWTGERGTVITLSTVAIEAALVSDGEKV